MKNKISSKSILLLSILMLSILAGIPLVAASPLPPTVNGTFVSSERTTERPGILGAANSGWKPDIPVANNPNTTEINPSIGTYINPATGAVTMYVALQYFDGVRYILQIYLSVNRGNSWSWWFSGWWSNPGTRSIINPSIAVSPYNGTVFVAVQDGPVGVTFSNDISLWRIGGGSWYHYNIDADAHNEQSPQLISEYAFGAGNWLYVVYENYTSYDDRDLMFGRSTDWGQTWTTMLLRGGDYDDNLYTQASIAYAQQNIYIAYRHSLDYNTIGHIDVDYSTNYGTSFFDIFDVSLVQVDASWPSIAGSHIGPGHQPSTVIVAYEYNTTATNHDILYTWSTDYGATWTGGSDYWHQIAASASHEEKPRLAVDGMGTENMNVGGNFHLIYDMGYNLFYTQLPYWDLPIEYGGHAFWGYYLGWSTPQGQVTDSNAWVSYSYRMATLTTYTRVVGGEAIWEPGVAWTDYRGPTYDILYSTPGTDFSITFVPSSQSVVAGKSASYYVTVNLLAGPAATVYLGGTVHYPVYQSVYATMDYSVWQVTPTATSTLTVYTSNLMPAGAKQLTATATVGGYRRMVLVPYTVIAPPTLTLNLNPTTVARGAKLTISGQLTPAPGAPTTIYLYYRYPHQSGTWKLATTLSTNAAGAFTVSATVPVSMTPGMYDLVAFWVNTQTGSYAVSPIKVFTIT
jgi:hypothetical protein